MLYRDYFKEERFACSEWSLESWDYSYSLAIYYIIWCGIYLTLERYLSTKIESV